jgi:hypothetical protein
MADTTYIVLQQTDAPAPMDWCQVGSYDAPNADQAIRQAVDRPGLYVAVPARSWKPVTVTTETRTVLKLEQPDTAA